MQTKANTDYINKAAYRTTFRNVLPHVALAILSIIFVFPFLWMVSTSLRTFQEASTLSVSLIPKKIIWFNYVDIFVRIPLLRYILNTLFITVISVIGHLMSSTLAAYGISHIDWKGKNIVFTLVLATMMIPIQVTMIPLYIIFNKLGMIGSYLPLILPAFFGSGGLYIFLTRQFFLTIPQSLIQAAKIDGASEFRIYRQIIIPLSKPVLATVGMFVFLYTWSDFTNPLIYLQNPNRYTISLGLYAFISERYVEWQYLMGASVVFTIPIIIMFFVAQKQFIEGITVTGIKG